MHHATKLEAPKAVLFNILICLICPSSQSDDVNPCDMVDMQPKCDAIKLLWVASSKIQLRSTLIQKMVDNLFENICEIHLLLLISVLWSKFNLRVKGMK